MVGLRRCLLPWFRVVLVLAFGAEVVAHAAVADTATNLPPAVQEVLKLTQAQMGDEIILAYFKKSGAVVSLSADDVVFLKGKGVSEPVIAALLESRPPETMPAPVPAEPGPTAALADAGTNSVPTPAGLPAAEVNFNYFRDQLAPFGSWVEVGGVMYWRPDAAIRVNPDFRPYYDMGRWVQTENGLFWQSDYVWGDIPFHYGRWVRDPALGWLWLPEYEWAPAWVFWRHAEVDLAVGWAPLPVGAVVVEGGYLWHGARVGLGFDFGLGEGMFVFVGFNHFQEDFFRMRGREWAWHMHGERLHDVYRRSVVRNEFHRDAGGRLINNGIGRERIQAATHGRLERADFQERKPVGDRSTLARDHAQRAAPSPAKASDRPGGSGTGRAGAAVASHPAASSAASGNKVYRPPASANTASAAAKKK